MEKLKQCSTTGMIGIAFGMNLIAFIGTNFGIVISSSNIVAVSGKNIKVCLGRVAIVTIVSIIAVNKFKLVGIY